MKILPHSHVKWIFFFEARPKTGSCDGMIFHVFEGFKCFNASQVDAEDFIRFMEFEMVLEN